jgi:hypothetical protein
MKKIILAVCFVFFIPSLLFADEVDKGLPADTSSRIKENARQVIQLGIEANTTIKVTRDMLANNFTEHQILAGLELLMKSKKQNLSEAPIINKLYEGIAKNVGAENILQAMDKVRSRYELANSYTQNLKTNEEQSRLVSTEMAECMAAGIDKSSMNKIMEILQLKSRNIGRDDAFELNEKTLKTARTMARSGVDSRDILDIMSSAFQRNYNAGEMEQLGNTFMSQAKGSASASDLAKAYSSAIKNGATAKNIERINIGTPPNSGLASGAQPPIGAPNPGAPVTAGSPAPLGSSPGGSPPGASPSGTPPAGSPSGIAPGAVNK